MQREWAEAKKELQEERQNARNITLDRDQTLKGAMKQVEDLGKQLADALHAVAAAESKAAAVEVVLILSRNCLFHVHFFCTDIFVHYLMVTVIATLVVFVLSDQIFRSGEKDQIYWVKGIILELIMIGMTKLT